MHGDDSVIQFANTFYNTQGRIDVSLESYNSIHLTLLFNTDLPIQVNKFFKTLSSLPDINIMAKFTDLPNKLILKICSHIRKCSHRLNLVKLNQRTHNLIIPTLYENITLDHRDCDPLRSRLADPTLKPILSFPLRNSDLKASIRSIDVYTLVAEYVSMFQNLHDLLWDSNLPCLKHMTLVTMCHQQWHWTPNEITLRAALRGARSTHQSLVLSIDQPLNELMRAQPIWTTARLPARFRTTEAVEHPKPYLTRLREPLQDTAAYCERTAATKPAGSDNPLLGWRLCLHSEELGRRGSLLPRR